MDRFVFILSILATTVQGFAPGAGSLHYNRNSFLLSSELSTLKCSSPIPFSTRVSSSTALSALPPFIIRSIIKNFQENKEKTQPPLVDSTEAANEASGLRIGKNSWKWPPIWPYDSSFFLATVEVEAQNKRTSMASMASMLSGVAQVPTESDHVADEDKFDPVDYWTKKQATVPPSLMDEEVIENLKNHFSFYIRDDASILEFGAGENSYLPDTIQPSRHVGININPSAMEKNPSLTQRLVVDLNKVVPDRDVDSDDLRSLASEPFDAIIMTNTVAFLTSPREVFRSAWYLLKPGGIMIVAFSGKDATKDKFSDAQTRAWQLYNDDQHMWITGSFFQFSAGDGWDSLIGFDISPESAKGESGPLDMLRSGKNNKLFVVQAVKGYQEAFIDVNDPERSIKSLTWMLPVLESRDKSLVVPRLARAYQLAASDDIRDAIERNVEHLPKIYEALMKMDQYAFSFGMQSQLAADLVSNPNFCGHEEQMLALRQGLGLRTPSPEFWAPVGKLTSAMGAEEKINLLAYIVPHFGSGDASQEEALQAFVSALEPTFAAIRSKCPDISEADVQLLGTEFLAAEVLPVGQSTREEFAQWINEMTREEMIDILELRKSFPLSAKEELAEFRKARKEEEERREDYNRRMEEQVQTARKERSLVFNPRSRKMEVFTAKK